MASSSTAASSGLPHITVLGSLNMDLVSYVAHHPEPGETMTSNAFAISPGGKGANQAVACAKLSRRRRAAAVDSEQQQQEADNATATAHVSMVGAVADDANGAALRANLSKQGVDVAGVQVLPSSSTGVAVIVVDEPTGQNRIILSPGANYAFGWHDGLLSTPAPQLLILQLEIPLALVLRALHEARARGIPVLLNPAPAPATDDARAALEAAWAGDTSSSGGVGGIAHLVLNETETAALVPGLTVRDLDTRAGLATAAQYFLDRGVENIVMTLGGRGVYYATAAAGEATATPGELVPPEPVQQVVDTTGAGDTFAGAYALEVVYAAAQGRPFDCAAAVRKSNRAAAKTVQRKGAQDSIPWLDELE